MEKWKKDNFYPTLNFGLIEEKYSNLENSPFVVLPIPYDGTTTFKTGAREGPAEIINASQFVELYDHELKKETFKVGIHTLPEMIPAILGPKEMMERIYEVAASLLKKKKIIVSLGGDHSVSIGLIKAYVEKYPKLSVLQFDAHSDLRDEYEDSKISSATSMRRASEMGAKIIQVGIRAASMEEVKFVQEKGIKQFFAEEILGKNKEEWIKEVVKTLEDNVYISFDVDFFDSSLMPATGTPEPGGLGWYEAISLLKEVAQKKKIVGFDVVELSPSLGPHACSFLVAKLIYKLIGYISTFQKSSSLVSP